MEKQLSQVKSTLLEMGGGVEKALGLLADAFGTNDQKVYDEVRTIENGINALHKEVDLLCLQILAMQSPRAKDLRFILSCIKINTDLERMGDQCVNISHTSKDYTTRTSLAEIKSVLTMAKKVRSMLRRSLDCFVSNQLNDAQEILTLDDEIDAFKNQIFQEMIQVMKTNSEKVAPALDLILIARNLERIADHCTNIAEDVIFSLTGDDVRHGGTGG